MKIINMFRETSFLKEDNELENKVNILTELHNKYPNNEKIAKDLTLANLGLSGEKNIKHELKNNLTQFRINKSHSKNIPEHYIFDDKELEIFLNKIPKTIDELRVILPDVKIKYHGEEIIPIINELF